MKKLITMAVLSFCMTAAVSGAQPSDKDDQQIEKRIEKLVRKMTLEEKVSLLHGNSKFYVSEIKRLGIPEWSLSDGPHGVRAEINRHDWGYANWTTDSSTYFPNRYCLCSRLESGTGLLPGRSVGGRSPVA